jgi:hypothetical protein
MLTDEYCLYIQKINVELDDSKIKRIIEFSFQIGKVLRIEHVRKTEQYLSTFVYISHINWSSSSTIELLLSIENSKSYKLVLWWMDDDVYWIVRKKCLSSDVIQNLQKKIVYLEEIILKQQQTMNTHSKMMKHILRKDNFFYISDSEEEDENIL